MLRLIFAATAFVAIHIAILSGAIPVAVALVFLSLAFAPAATAIRAEGRNRWLYVAMAGALFLLAGGAIYWPGVDGRVALILPSILASMLTSGFFAYSLLPGQVPVIVRMCHVSRGAELPDGLERYARILTWGWVILPAFLAAATLAALAFMGLRAWSWAANVASPIALAAFFIGEHFYRGWRLPHLGRPSVLRTFDIMLKPTSWRRST